MIGKLFDTLTEYIKARLDVMKLTLVERTALLMGYFMFLLTGLMVVTAILIFLGFGLAIVFGDLCNSPAAGFFITAGIYALLVFIVAMQKTRLLNWMAGLFINMLTGDDDESKPTNRNNG